jgi:UDPglucose--hexose-1-phosphate uridylyltransferase
MSIEPEFRQDPVCGRWAIIAPERSHRPKTLEGAEPRHRREGERKPCPFCPGQEYDTPDEVLAYRPFDSSPNGPGWQLRVVPNKFPAVRPDLVTLSSTADSTADTTTDKNMFLASPGLGRAEVLIECPEHLPDPTHLSDSQFSAVFSAYRDRLIALADEVQLAYASVFKNVGAEAGASLGHTHSQIIATPIVPGIIESELAGSAAHFSRTNRCIFCDIAHREMTDRDRLIAQSENFLVLSAFAPRFEREFWLLPKRHVSRYEAISSAECLELARLMKRVLSSLDIIMDKPAYNWSLHTAPLRSTEMPHYHWHIEVMPRISRPAGLEWGFGCYIIAVSPEQSAREFREHLS